MLANNKKNNMNEFNQVAMWLSWNEDGSFTPKCKIFPSGELGTALKFTESLRRSKFTQEPVQDEVSGELYGTNVSHITIAGDVPGNVTKPGVDVTDSSYNWKKRRK